MKRKMLMQIYAVAACLVVANSALATEVVYNSDMTRITGLAGVDVGGKSYLATFHAGSYLDTGFLLSGDKDFAIAANGQLLSLLNGELSGTTFDTDVIATVGCDRSAFCQIATPWELILDNEYIAIQSVLNYPANGTDVLIPGATVKSFEDQDNRTFVEWTPSSVVPVPAAVWLFGSGLIGLIGVARRKKA
jgi:hypothetical protein